MKFKRIANGYYETYINNSKYIISKNHTTNLWEIKKLVVSNLYGQEKANVIILERHDTYPQARKDLEECFEYYESKRIGK